MSPAPIIARQRALSRIGEIRLGGEQRTNPKTGKPLVGQKLDTFRLTSQQKDIIDRCAQLYGGQVKPWESPSGPAWQVVTDVSALPIFVVVGYSLRLQYELWEGATKCTRRCDGITEMLTDTACICNEQGEDRCDVVTRLTVVLPETGTSLGWYLRSIGQNAANELAGAMAIAEGIANGRTFIPATLRLTQRRGVKDGQVVRYVVPVLDFDPQRAALDADTPRAIESGHTPLRQAPAGLSLAAGLAVVEKPVEAATGGRQPAPLPATGATPKPEPVPVNEDTPAPNPDLVSRSQVDRLWAVSHDYSLNEEATHRVIRETVGLDHSTEILKDDYDRVVDAIRWEGGTAQLIDLCGQLGTDLGSVGELIVQHDRDCDWLDRQLATARKNLDQQETIFQVPAKARRKAAP